MDRITRSLLGEFSTQYDLTHLGEDKQFEYFCTYLVASRHLGETFDPATLGTGSGADTGIDGLAIIVNGSLTVDVDQVNDLAEHAGYLEVSFVFVQADRSESFSASKTGSFGFGVADFFSDNPGLTRNEAILDSSKIMTAIYNHSSMFKRGNPACRLYYVTTGKWSGDHDIEARREAVVRDLGDLRLFSSVDFTLVGADEIQKLYNQTKNAISRDFMFPDRTLVPDIPGVSEAYLGIIPARTFLTLVQDEDGDIIRNIFYDNVRDFQGYNPVNEGIRSAVHDSSARRRFVLMNNGVTVIAKAMRTTGNKIHIEDYQIVNGCQTSHVLHAGASSLDDSMMIPLRVIATQDDEVISDIIKATNRQTEVGEDQLLALSDYQKKLERYFIAFADLSKRLYYERRSRQYNADTTVEKTRIITPGSLIRAYAAMFLDEPHRATRNYRALLDRVGQSVFVDDHRLEGYYAAAFCFYRLEYLFRNQQLEAKYKPARYQLLSAFRWLLPLGDPPRPNSHEFERYCEKLLAVVHDTERSVRVFARAAEVVDRVAHGNLDRDHIRTQPYTENVKNACRADEFEPAIFNG